VEKREPRVLLAEEFLVEWIVVAKPPEAVDSRKGLRNVTQAMKMAKLSCIVVAR